MKLSNLPSLSALAVLLSSSATLGQDINVTSANVTASDYNGTDFNATDSPSYLVLNSTFETLQPSPAPVVNTTSSTSAPTPLVVPNVTDAPTVVNVAVPTSAPIIADGSAPTKTPTITTTTTGAPQKGAGKDNTGSGTPAPSIEQVTSAPIIADTDNTTTSSPIAADVFPTVSPASSTNGSPTDTNVTEGTCEEVRECRLLGLEGACCPTMDGWTLDCCGAVVNRQCQDNSKCAALKLESLCCPTVDEKYLDCCDAVPDSCQAGNCTRYSAKEYAAELASASSAYTAFRFVSTLSVVSACAVVAMIV